ncbi:hypothetical protein [Mesorhizobium tamadayense]|uniref:hypothetical protein n=1 Tax=Mesorhizobium tamadayense TaxID=425306 RepID=UPI00142D9374|nr:hypothetical protein [Mesorhizobium tamadayense]
MEELAVAVLPVAQYQTFGADRRHFDKFFPANTIKVHNFARADLEAAAAADAGSVRYSRIHLEPSRMVKSLLIVNSPTQQALLQLLSARRADTMLKQAAQNDQGVVVGTGW